MKKLFTIVAAALMSASAFAQAHCEWTASQLPAAKFATVEEAVAAGYNTLWTMPQYLGMPACDLINNENIQVSLPLAYNYVSTGNNKYSGTSYAYKLIMGMNNSTRDGIDPIEFTNGVVDNGYVRTSGTSDQGNVVNDAIIKVEVKSANYGSITLKYNRGGNNSAMYVVDQTKSKNVLWSVTRCPDANVQTHVARFGVEPGHVYYIMASEKGSVELYGIEYDECADENYTILATTDNSTDLWTAAQLPSEVFAGKAAAEAAGYNTLWTLPQYLGMPACDLINSGNVVVSLPLAYNYVSTGNNKYSGANYAYKLIMGMNNSTRDGIDPIEFTNGVVDNGYVRTSGTSDQGNVVNDAIVKISIPAEGTYGRVILNYNRGGNNSAMYVVDQTKGNQVLQSTTRCPDDAVKTHSAIFNVQPGHDYYVMASEKGSVELYAIGYCGADDAKYGTSLTTGIQEVLTNNGNNGGDKTVKAIYSIDGSQVNGLQKGLNIIKYSDGTAKKVIK
ncbi:MAG: hypothetical protein PT953_03485 [Prevotella sp.]|nr:hypothetical protein [Prevotella sp.]